MAIVQKATRFEVWSDLEAAGGERLAVLPRVESASATVALTGDDVLSLRLRNADASALVEGRVVRVVESDSEWDEWRLHTVDSDSETGYTECQAASVAQELTDKVIVGTVAADGAVAYDVDLAGISPSDIITGIILPSLERAGVTWFSFGSAANDYPIDTRFKWATPLAALLQLAAASDQELQITRVGTTGYQIDLVDEVGSGAALSHLRAGRNLPQLKYGRSTLGAPTRIYPQGAEEDGISATMAGATWIAGTITAITGGYTVHLSDALGGPGPIAIAGQLAGTTALLLPDGTNLPITASDVAAQTVTVADIGTLEEGDRVTVKLRDPDTGDLSDLTYLENPAAVAADGGLRVGILARTDIPNTQNLVLDPIMRDWDVELAPPDWATVGPGVTITRDTSVIALGGAASAKLETAGDGEGLETNDIDLFPSESVPYVSGYMHLFVLSGQVRVELVLSNPAADAPNQWVLPSGADLATSSQLNAWIDLGVSGIDALHIGKDSLGADVKATKARIRVVQHGSTPAVFYVAGAQITPTASQRQFLEGNCGTRLWQAANAELASRVDLGAAISLTAKIVDLARIDPARWALDSTIVLGGRVRIHDVSVGASFETRIVGVVRDYKVPGNSAVTLSSDPKDLTRLTLGGAFPPRLPGVPSFPDQSDVTNGPVPLIGPIGGEESAFGGGVNREGMIWLRVRFSKGTERIEIYGSESATTPTPVPEIAENRKCWTVRRMDGAVASAEEWETWVMVATRNAYYRKLIILPIGFDGQRGPTQVLEAQAVDVGTGPAAKPTNLVVTQAANANQLVFTNNDPLSTHLIFRNGVVVRELPKGQNAWNDEGLEATVPYTYDACAFRNFQTSEPAGASTIGAPDEAANAPEWVTGYPKGVANGCEFRWTADPDAVSIVVQYVLAIVGMGTWFDLTLPLSGAANIPNGILVDSSFLLGTDTQVRLKQVMPDGSAQYSETAIAHWGIKPLTKPMVDSVQVIGSDVWIAWSCIDSTATKIEIETQANSGAPWIVQHSTTTPSEIASDSFAWTPDPIPYGAKVHAVATYPTGKAYSQERTVGGFV